MIICLSFTPAGVFQEFSRFLGGIYEFIVIFNLYKTEIWHMYACYSAQKLYFWDQYTQFIVYENMMSKNSKVSQKKKTKKAFFDIFYWF